MPIGMIDNQKKIVDNSVVKVNVSVNDERPMYYLVKSNKADEFTSAFKKQAKKTNIITNVSFFGALIGGTIAGMVLTRKISSAFIRYVLNCAAGVAAGMGAYEVVGRISKAKQYNLVKKYSAKPES